jgi:hypothetical protein
MNASTHAKAPMYSHWNNGHFQELVFASDHRHRAHTLQGEDVEDH